MSKPFNDDRNDGLSPTSREPDGSPATDPISFLSSLRDEFSSNKTHDDLTTIVAGKLCNYFNINTVRFIEITGSDDSEAVFAHDHSDIIDVLSDKGLELIKSGQPIAINETSASPFVHAAKCAAVRAGSMVIVPFADPGPSTFLALIADSDTRSWTMAEVALLTEVTDRVFLRLRQSRTENALQQINHRFAHALAAEQKYRSLFNSIDEGFYLMEIIRNDEGKAVDIFYLDENAAAARMIGQSAKGRLMSDLSPDYEQYWRDIFGQTALTGQARRLQNFAAANEIWFDYYVFKPEGFKDDFTVAVVFHDVTAKKSTEAQQKFLIQLSDGVRALTSSVQIKKLQRVSWVRA